MLEIESVSVRFGGLRAVDAVSLRVPVGERHAVIGPNGAGKTTLFNAIAGLVPPSSGRILLGGVDITSASVPRRAGLGISRTFQITNLFPSLTIAETMRLGLHGKSWRKYALFASDRLDGTQMARAREALEVCGLARHEAVVVSALSYGEQRQLELALALATRPRVLLLDEPAAGLSPSERRIVARIITALPRDLTLLLIEHDMDLVLQLVDQITCLENGHLIASGTPAQIRDDETVRRVYLGTPHARA